MAGGLGFAAVAAGAFGAHALGDLLGDDALRLWETAARYQMYHALAILLVATVIHRSGFEASLRFAAWSWFAGVVLFSGSLYLLALTGFRWLGAVTPLGGVMLLAGWAALIRKSLRVDTTASGIGRDRSTEPEEKAQMRPRQTDSP